MERSGTRREAILEAMIRVVGSKGYTAASVADVVTEADASRTTFYKHFADKRDCFLAAYDLGAARIVGAASAGCAQGRSWAERAEGGLVAVVELLGRAADKVADLPGLLPELRFALLVPYLGPRSKGSRCGLPPSARGSGQTRVVAQPPQDGVGVGEQLQPLTPRLRATSSGQESKSSAITIRPARAPGLRRAARELGRGTN